MKFVHLALPLLASLAVARSIVKDDCQCPQVKCPDTDTVEGCKCVNFAEMACRKRCPKYIPTKFKICPLPKQSTTLPNPSPAPTPPVLNIPLPDLPGLPLPDLVIPLPPILALADKPRVPGCECEEAFCIQSYPDSCHCAWGVAKTCYDKCGGKSPGPNTCPPLGGGPIDGPVKREAAPEPQAVSATAGVSAAVGLTALTPAKPIKDCVCENRMCIMSYPAGCICANANAHACWKKCGGVKPAFSSCGSPIKPPVVSPPKAKVQICGGGRANTRPCPSGYTCINDPYKSGCGLECDGTGICVEEKLCGGFAGFQCETKGQVCVDDPRDECSPKTGGADCGGLCVWPPSMRA